MLEKDLELEIANKALKIRAFEKSLLDHFSSGKLNGTTHTCIGQEISGVLIGLIASKHDIIISNHRCHGHYLGLTNDYAGLANELLGNEDGVNSGVGGSQHISIPRRFYSNGIQGGMVGYAAGAAKAIYTQNRGIVYNFLGDGTFGEGALFEGLNLSKTLNCPVLYFVEDNGISQSTHTKGVQAGKIAKKFDAFDIIYQEIRHDDVETLYTTVQKFSEEILENGQPKAIIWSCQRLGPHSKGDDTRETASINEMWSVDWLLNFFGSSYQEKLEVGIKDVEKLFSQLETSEDAERKNYEVVPLKLNNPAPLKPILEEQLRNQNNSVLQEINFWLSKILENNLGILVGEDILDPYGGAFKATKGLSTNYPLKVFSSSISEAGMVSFGIGYSAHAEAVIVEIMFGDFITLIADQIVNHCSKFSYLHDNKPNLIIRTPIGGGRGYGATHSQCLEKIFGGLPSVYIEQISFLHDIGDCYRQAISREGCTIISEPKLQYGMQHGHLPKYVDGFLSLKHLHDSYQNHWVHLEQDDSEITIIVSPVALPNTIKSSLDLMLDHEIAVNILSPRRLSPLRLEKEITSILKQKILVIDESFEGYGFAEDVIAKLSMIEHSSFVFENCLLKNGVYPSSARLEKDFLQRSDTIISKARSLNEI